MDEPTTLELNAAARTAIAALLAYDDVIRANDGGTGDVLRAVADDDDGEVYDEVLDLAAERGIDLSAFDDTPTLHALVTAYRRVLSSELDGRPILAS